MVDATRDPDVWVDPFIRARSDCFRALRALQSAELACGLPGAPERRIALESALGAALALQVDVRDLLARLPDPATGPDLSALELRALDGDR